MPSKKEQDKINRLKGLYDLSKPEDLFTLLPQEMEMMDAKGMALGLDGAARKKEVLDVIMGIAKANKLKIDKQLISVFIDTIARAAKGEFAINRKQL